MTAKNTREEYKQIDQEANRRNNAENCLATLAVFPAEGMSSNCRNSGNYNERNRQ